MLGGGKHRQEDLDLSVQSEHMMILTHKVTILCVRQNLMIGMTAFRNVSTITNIDSTFLCL